MRIIISIILLIAMTGCVITTQNTEAIRKRLSDTHGLGAHNIWIEEKSGGLIVLDGKVASAQDRQTIERVARDTRGIKEVKSNLLVTANCN